MWANKNVFFDNNGLLHGGPISPSAFSFTLHLAMVEAVAKLVTLGNCARFIMDGIYFIGPREIVF